MRASEPAPELHGIVERRLRADGQRYTAGRRALVEALADAGRPVALADLLVGGLAQSSAYRNLAVLERAGVAHRISSTDGFGRYELAEDLTEHHHHLICSACGSVTDFTVPAEVESRLDDALRRVASRSRFVVEHHRLDLVGRCADCRA